MQEQQQPKQQSRPFSVANFCCLSGLGLILYGAFMLHPAFGYSAAGAGLIVFGVFQKRG